MPSRVARFAGRFIETGWLAAVIVVPLFFNVWSNRVFEPDKLTLLRTIALAICAAGLVLWIERGAPRPDAAELRRWLATPLVLPVLVLTAVYGFATLASRVPHLSLFGSYNRLQGLYTWLAYVVLFVALLVLLRRRDQLERLVQALILASLPIALYAVVQRFGLDPMPWLGDVTRRIASTMGNSIFVAAYLVMVIPLTLARLVEALRALESDDSSAAVYRVTGYLVLVLVQVAAVVLSQSRGPLLGLMGGIFFLLLLFAALRGRRAILAVLGAGAAVAAFLVVFNLPGSPLEPYRDLPYVGRLGQVFETDSGTGRVRVLIWEGAIDLIASDPLRAVIGHGPETMHVVYNPFYPPELGSLESRNASPDRSHNETYDTIVQAGVLGLLAYLALFTAVFAYGLRWLGLVESARQRNVFLGFWLGGGALSVLGFYLWRGSWTFFGVALPAGLVAGLMAFVVYRALRGWEAPQQPSRLLIAGLLAGLIAHFIEIHFGIAIAATRTLFFVMAGAMVVVGGLVSSRPGLLSEAEAADLPAETDAEPAARKRRKRARRSTRRAGAEPARSGPWAASGMLLLAILVTMVFDFIVRSQLDLSAGAPDNGRATLLVSLWLFGLTWFLGAVILVSELVMGQRSRDGLWTFVGLSLGGTFAYAFLHWILLSGGAGTDGASVSSTLLIVYYLALFSILLLWAWLLARGSGAPETLVASRVAWLYPLLAIGVLVLALFTNVNEVRADIRYKQAFTGYHAQATRYVNQGNAALADAAYSSAVRDYDRALGLDGQEDYYLLFKGKALLEQADAKGGELDAALRGQGVVSEYADPGAPYASLVTARDRLFDQALVVLQEAYETMPLNTDHSANLARAYQVWGDRTHDPERKAERLEESRAWFRGDEARGIPGAIALSPANAGLREEMATTEFIAGDEEAALRWIDEALEVDPGFARPLRLRATMRIEQAEAAGDTEEADRLWAQAAEDYEAYVSSRDGRGDPSAWSGLALVRARMGDMEGAREANVRVLDVAPNDLDTLRNLAIVDRDLGNLEGACEWAARGLESHEGDPGLQQLSEQLGCATGPGATEGGDE